MSLFESIIKPYFGIDNISLDKSYDEVRQFLKNNNYKYNVDTYPNKGCVPEVEWKVIRIEGGINVYFALDKMFKIDFIGNYKGKLFNGLFIGMSMGEAVAIDSTLKYNDEEEDYASVDGYWIEDDLDTNKVMRITVFIKELLDEDDFFTYNWAK